MDQVIVLENEISELRRILNVKENELKDLKTWINNQQPSNGIHQMEQDVQLMTSSKPPHDGWLPKWAIERYSRQILLSDIGVQGQVKICSAKVLVVGAGGLGCPAAMYLAGAGIGEIGIIDYDTVDVTNVHRQLLHYERNENSSKANSAADTLRSINSKIKITPYNTQLDSKNAKEIASSYDLVLDCTDNVPTRYLLNDLCVMLKIPLISGSALKMEGQLTIYGYRRHEEDNHEPSFIGPCYRCVFPTPPPPEAVGSCSANGVAGPIPGVIGTLQALEAIKYIIGRTEKQLLVERMLLFDGEDICFRTVKLRPRNVNCSVCSDTATVKLIDYEVFCQAQAKEKINAHLMSERRKMEKEKRMLGQSYYGFRVEDDGAKKRYIQDVLKSERHLRARCNSDVCCKSSNKKCSMISDNGRMDIFRYFWYDLDWRAKKAYVRSLVDVVPPKRRRSKHKGLISRKGASRVYYLRLRDEKLSVCRVMFLHTLDIKEATLRCWLSPNTDAKSIKMSKNSIALHHYIDALPKTQMKCHNCQTTKPDIFIIIDNIKNANQLYCMYVNDMKKKGFSYVSRKTFMKIMKEKRLTVNNERICGNCHSDIDSLSCCQTEQRW